MADYPAELYLDNGFNARAGTADAPLMVESPTTGVVGVFSGASITCFVALTDAHDAAPIAGLTMLLTEIGTTGAYIGGFSGTALTSALSALLDTRVYVHYDTQDGVYHRVEEAMVRGSRSGR